MGKRKVANPLALAVLALLAEKPMHPYEMSSTLRERAKEQSIKLNYGSLYSVVDSLVRRKLIEVQETVRDGRRPERTVYTITDLGRIEMVDWMCEMLALPVKEYLQFEAARARAGGRRAERGGLGAGGRRVTRRRPQLGATTVTSLLTSR